MATTNLKTKTNQNCQKIELYGSLTTKELKKKHSSRLVREAEIGSLNGKDMQQGGSWQTGWSHTGVQINQKEQLGSKTPRNPGFQHREIKPQNLWL